MILDFSIKEQLFCCLICVAAGIIFGILYDFLRVVCLLLGIDPHGNNKRGVILYISVVILDFMYMTIVSVIFAVVMYAFAYGKFRLVFAICSLAGFILYNRSLSRIVIYILDKFITAIKVTVRFFFRTVLYPIKKIVKLLGVVGYFMYSVTLKILLMKLIRYWDILRYNKISRSIDDLIKFNDV